MHEEYKHLAKRVLSGTAGGGGLAPSNKPGGGPSHPPPDTQFVWERLLLVPTEQPDRSREISEGKHASACLSSSCPRRTKKAVSNSSINLILRWTTQAEDNSPESNKKMLGSCSPTSSVGKHPQEHKWEENQAKTVMQRSFQN